MSTPGLSHFNKLCLHEYGSVSEYLPLHDKIILHRVNHQTLRDAPEVISRIQTGLRKDIDHIIKFAAEHFQATAPEKQAVSKLTEECYALVGTVTHLYKVDEIKQKIIGKLFLSIVNSNLPKEGVNLKTLAANLPLSYMRAEFDRCLITREPFLRNSSMRDQQARYNMIFPTLLLANRLSEAKAVAQIHDEHDQEQAFESILLYTFLDQMVKAGTLNESILKLSQIPDGPSKQQFVVQLINLLTKKGHFAKAVEVANSQLIVSDKISLFHHIAEAYCLVQLPLKALELRMDLDEQVHREDHEVLKEKIESTVIHNYIHTGLLDEAAQLLAQDPNCRDKRSFIFEDLAQKFAQNGEFKKAVFHLNQISDGRMDERMHVTWWVASLMVQAGEFDELFAMLDQMNKRVGGAVSAHNSLPTESVVTACVEAQRIDCAAEIIKLIPDTAYDLQYKRTASYEDYGKIVAGGVVDSIRKLIEKGSFAEAKMLVDAIANEPLRTKLQNKIAAEQAK